MKRVLLVGLQATILVCLLFLALAWREYSSQPASVPVHKDEQKIWQGDYPSSRTELAQSTRSSAHATTIRTSVKSETTSSAIHTEPRSSSISYSSPSTTHSAPSEETKNAFEVDRPKFEIDTKKYRAAILDPYDKSFDRLECPYPSHGRYDYLKAVNTSYDSRPKPKYFFALDLTNCTSILPRLLGSIVETIDFLGAPNCALSIVEGRSTDGTFEILSSLNKDFAPRGISYFFTSSDTNPVAEGVDRIEKLAALRNQALLPLTKVPNDYDPDATILFINDVALCMEDILELIHQKLLQKADMTCAMDWIFGGWSFYDVWISRTMHGDQFFEIPQSGTWDYADKLFWNDPSTKTRYDAGRPFQVFSCWNGATAFTAKPLLKHQTRFRTSLPGECFLGEPLHFAKDLWFLKYNKIAVIPSVNLGYNDEESRKIKAAHGSVREWTTGSRSNGQVAESIEWGRGPPEMIKCVPTYLDPSWVAWNEALNETLLAF